MSGQWHMMKTERMGLIALAAMLIALLIFNAASRCSCSRAPEAEPAGVAIGTGLHDTDSVSGTIANDAKSNRRSSRRSKKQKTEKTVVRPFQRQHRDEKTR